MKQHYELLYIIPMKYAVEDLEPIFTKVRELLKKYSGEITFEQNMGKQRLSYSIKDVHQGYYIVVEFDAEGENMKKLERELKLTEEILRFMIVSKKIKTEKDIEIEKKLAEKLSREKENKDREKEKEAKDELDKIKKQEPVTEEKPPVSKIKEEKVSLEDLDKKLDEILDENVL